MNITIEISNKYLKGKIYKVVDIGYNKCYVGSTCAELSQRMSSHMTKYKGFVNGKEQKAKYEFMIYLMNMELRIVKSN